MTIYSRKKENIIRTKIKSIITKSKTKKINWYLKKKSTLTQCYALFPTVFFFFLNAATTNEKMQIISQSSKANPTA
jgi:hypothetical protein